MNESIDVVIPTFNETDNLLVAVLSCKAQTHPINRIIIVDDGSDEFTKRWLEEKFLDDPQIELVLNSHSGLPSTGRQIGISRSSAEWIAFLDADDSWIPTKIALQLETAKKENWDFVCTNASILSNADTNIYLLPKIPREISFKNLVGTNYVINSSVIVRRKLLIRVGYATSPRVRAVEDYATWLRVATIAKLGSIDAPLTRYRISPNSIRSKDQSDPRVHAFADFLLWADALSTSKMMVTRKYKRTVMKQMEKQYAN
jgi:glycosyltransferase involved in cell wall biosynthesis